MRTPAKFFWRTATLAGLLLGIGGCGTVGDGGGAVYGDFGAAGPWYYSAPWYSEGGVYVHPPYDHGRPGPGGRSAPSIPSRPRPAPSRGGGGGGRPSGGGGDHRR